MDSLIRNETDDGMSYTVVFVYKRWNYSTTVGTQTCDLHYTTQSVCIINSI